MCFFECRAFWIPRELRLFYFASHCDLRFYEAFVPDIFYLTPSAKRRVPSRLYSPLNISPPLFVLKSLPSVRLQCIRFFSPFLLLKTVFCFPYSRFEHMLSLRILRSRLSVRLFFSLFDSLIFPLSVRTLCRNVVILMPHTVFKYGFCYILPFSPLKFFRGFISTAFFLRWSRQLPSCFPTPMRLSA